MCKTYPCSSPKRQSLYKESASIINLLLIALLPKCPFCILSFGSAIAMCGTANVQTGWADWAWELTLLWALTTNGLIIFNHKGRRTLYALGLTIPGSVIILASHISSGVDPLVFFAGSALLFGGIWVNGSFGYFYKRIKQNLPIIYSDPSIRTR